MILMKKLFLLFLVIPFFLVGFTNTNTFITEVPDDFRLTAISGSVSPDYPVYKIELAADGEGVYSVMPPEGRQNGKFKAVNRFKLDEIQLLLVYRAVMENNFFGLEKEYRDSSILDGSFARLTVSVGGKSHTVRTQNIAVKGFDKIMLMINAVTPENNKMLYNEILL